MQKGKKTSVLNIVKTSAVLYVTSERRTPTQGHSHGFHYHIELIKNSSTPGKYHPGMKV